MCEKKVTLSDIAKKTKLSKGAVSFALRNSPMVSQKTKARVAKVAEELGYQRNELFSSMMSKMKRSDVSSFSESIALINANPDEYILSKHPTLIKYYIGIKEEAKRFGYTINEIWLYDSRLRRKSISKMLESRGIRGGIVLGHFSGLPHEYDFLWRDFFFISVGVKTPDCPLEMVSVDHYAVTFLAFSKVIEKGFKRPAIIMDKSVDKLVDGRFVAGYMRAQLEIPHENRLDPFMESDSEPDYPAKLQAWIEKNKPDVILYLLDSTRELVLNMPRVGKKSIPLVQLEQRGFVPKWTGVEQNNEIVGRVALRRLADMLSRRSARIGENARMVISVPPDWVEGKKVRERK